MSQNVEVTCLDEYLLVHGVEFVGLVTRNGRLVDYRAKNGLKFSEGQKEMFFMSVSLYQTMQHDYDDSFGAVRYTITERENFRIVTIPNGQDTLVIVIKGSFSSTVKKVLDAINHVKNQDSENKNMKSSKTR
jgi:roadblock/LC7 domain-containing protein